MKREREGESKVRKVRSDKKREVKPTVSLYIRNNLFTISRLTGMPVKDVALIMVNWAFYNDDVMRQLQPKMISNFAISNRIYVGNREPYPFKVAYKGATGKITIKFPQDIYETLRKLAFSIGTTPTTICAVLIRRAMFTPSFMEEHALRYKRYLKHPQQYEELYKFIETLSETIPQEKEKVKKWNFFD